MRSRSGKGTVAGTDELVHTIGEEPGRHDREKYRTEWLILHLAQALPEILCSRRLRVPCRLYQKNTDQHEDYSARRNAEATRLYDPAPPVRIHLRQPQL